ncbi:hypothetical protein I3843_16G075700 [Carya illinoinensis]|nr:hypothetical protein I3843_16G075700 [Carya illinoinensis]
MADSTHPLLTLADTGESEDTPPLVKHLPSLDSTIESVIGNFGWPQFLQAVLQTFISVFTDAHPTWHCTQLGDESCNSASNICNLPTNSWAWDLPADTSILSEWNLECAASFVSGLPASSFFTGCLVGGLVLSTLADSSLGRKNVLLLSCLMMSLSSLLTMIFSTNIWIYTALKFLCGFFRSAIGTCALVLSSELVGKRWRGQVGVGGFFCFSLGFLSLPAIAYMNRGSSWRSLYLWSSIPGIFYSILVHFFVRESPRWLFVNGREEEAMATLKSIASTHHGSSNWNFSGMCFEQETCNANLYSTLKILAEKKWACRRLSAVSVIAFGAGLVYYGMPLALGNLAFNLYLGLGVTFNALSELPAALFTFFCIGKLKRKNSILVFTTLSGVCSIMCVLKGKMWTRLQIGLELVSFFSSCTVVNIMLLYTIELFPTCVRNSAMSIAREALVLGGVFGPMLVAVGRKDGFESFGVFGLAIGCCGMFAACLPETRGATLCDTMEEEEHKLQKASCNWVGEF